MTTHLDAVSKTYGSPLRARIHPTVALHPTTLTLGSGVIGLLGPNGAGKTTLLRLLSTAMAPTAGRIVVEGHQTTASPAERTSARRLIGYLPQEVVFPRGMTAFGFLDYIAVLKEWDQTTARRAEVRRVLTLVGLQERSTVKVRKLSGGQRRRLAIAQALLGEPRLLILDEPTTGLDPEQRATLRRILSEQAGTVLLSTHQTEDVSALCDRVVVLDAGRIRFDSAVADLLATASDHVHVGPQENDGAVHTWRTGTGMVRSVGGLPRSGATPVPPTVEDAYLLLRSRSLDEGALR
ncbi:ATP-binding cassette domain-containing protein [Acidipropionibacterium jensenii]|uniref:Methionine import ATP-binding protein MetN n=1 Tax=Acidipropionibacterium jensenii TaxID=1749 RepID=A0A3S4UY86_9ACTN|nr:ATP-binding cassette domain-containing protein [Acidipropionibacterium jensenii]MDN5977710.1 ATP-binding cassette domain-containing protein [Acidipropionibacterium jensenii]MDN6020714.1 ATP-binding cassette domain-containing protein [Acidipropionibacterium jensenii]MDN6427482.1 ATP-binding cassette domain-containing protein [Acidipropionibacterium jensenii]MDN6442005.1 ATP-binding cassette domain-containing protein [Acidipropionibacterium jensenii]MDN6480352.1 ATP-binding cassette domain-co